LNQYSRSSKSLNSLKISFLELNAFKIFDSLKIRHALLRCVAGAGLQGAGRACASGGSCAIVYGTCTMYAFDIQAIRRKSIGYLPATGKEMSLQSAAEEKRLGRGDIGATVFLLS
jgi:hypothetical protein